MAFSGSQTTRLGLYGGARGLYGSFAGKTEAIELADAGEVFRARRNRIVSTASGYIVSRSERNRIVTEAAKR